MNCPRCGEEVKLARNLGKHQAGAVCKGFIFERRMRSRGWRPVPSRFAAWLTPLDIPCIYGPLMHIGEGKSRTVKVLWRHWVPEEVAEIIQRRIGVPTFSGPIKDSISSVKEKLCTWKEAMTSRAKTASSVFYDKFNHAIAEKSKYVLQTVCGRVIGQALYEYTARTEGPVTCLICLARMSLSG